MTAPAPRTVGVVLFPGVELLDFAGPAEVFVVAGEGRLFRVVTVAAGRAPVPTMGGLEVVPSHTFADAPPLDVVVVPGGATGQVPPEGVAWLRRAAAAAQVTLSVCYGAFLLARAGLLDGIEATTHTWGLADLGKAAPTCRVVTGRRVVDAGRVVSTGGVTAGIDGALHVLERLCGTEAARWTAEGWMEHRGPARRDADAPRPA